ncbi:MAG: L-seryl-tRNA(Sec) selenium transferase [Alphaproteobacteria bacterium]|nr:L-seryl-tRNA(Sec) selenium transferase [Alphaproteobacteria bacterium]
MPEPAARRADLPSLDRLLRSPPFVPLLARHGHVATAVAARTELAELRQAIGEQALPGSLPDDVALAERVGRRLAGAGRPRLARVFNLSGTVLHTNLGRAPLAEAAIQAAVGAAGAAALEYDLDNGRRGERDRAVADWLKRLTGADAAIVVNNNAAAVLLVLTALATRREVIVSRGELIEIGGAFRLPDIMAQAGCKLREVGTTNRTHARDYEAAIGPRSALLMKAHPSNYSIQGFTAEVAESELAALARRHDLPFYSDLGSGALIDLAVHGLPAEPTPQQMLAAGVDVVSFSADKLLGGPQAGLIVGRADLVGRIARHPLKRALRCDKLTLASLEATLALYAEPDLLRQRLPSLRLLTRPVSELSGLAERLLPALAMALGGGFVVTIEASKSQIGSGAQPVALLDSLALAVRPAGRRGQRGLDRLQTALRRLPVPVIGRLADGALMLDLRCLEDEAGFLAQLAALAAV